jgi:hypothetical protein
MYWSNHVLKIIYKDVDTAHWKYERLVLLQCYRLQANLGTLEKYMNIYS